MRERIWAAVSASLISYLIYVCTAVVAVFGEGKKTIGTDVMASITSNSSDILRFVVISLWFFILLTVIVVSLMFVIHDLALHTLQRPPRREEPQGDRSTCRPTLWRRS